MPVRPRATSPEPRTPDPRSRIPDPGSAPDPGSRIPDPGLKDPLLAEIRAKKALFYNTVVAQAQKIEVTPERVTFTFLPAHRALREQLELTRPWLEAAAEKIAGRKMSVVAVQSDGPTPAASAPSVKVPSPSFHRSAPTVAVVT